jgi:hypothetical protein
MNPAFAFGSGSAGGTDAATTAGLEASATMHLNLQNGCAVKCAPCAAEMSAQHTPICALKRVTKRAK